MATAVAPPQALVPATPVPETPVAQASAPNASKGASDAAPPAISGASTKAAHAAPNAEQGDEGAHKSHRKHGASFRTYIKRLLKRQHKSHFLTEEALHSLDNLCMCMVKELHRRATLLQSTKTLTLPAIRSAVNSFRSVGTTEIASAGDTALGAYKARLEDKAFFCKTRQERAGIVVPVAFTENMLRELSPGKVRLPDNVAVYTAAVVEAVLTWVLGSAVAEAEESKRAGILNQHLARAVEGTDLHAMFQELQVHLPRAGVAPGIDKFLLSKKNKKRLPKLPEGAPPRSRRARPGTAALRQIRSIQRSTDLQLQRQPFVRCCRAALQDINGTARLSKGVAYALQDYIESKITEWFAHANKIAVNAKRQTLKERDLVTAFELAGQAPPSAAPLQVSIEGIRRLARRAGVKIVTPEAITFARSAAGQLLGHIMHMTNNVAQTEKRSTLTCHHFKLAMEMTGVVVCSSAEWVAKTKRRRAPVSTEEAPEAPAAKKQKVESTPKAPAPKVATPKAPTPKAPAPKVATPKAPTPKAPAPKVATPKAPTPKAPAPKVATPKAPTPKAPKVAPKPK